MSNSINANDAHQVLKEDVVATLATHFSPQYSNCYVTRLMVAKEIEAALAEYILSSSIEVEIMKAAFKFTGL